jgi:hypothetical protein
MMDDVAVGTVVASRAEGEQIYLTIDLDGAVDADEVEGKGVISDPRGEWRTGHQIGVHLTPQFVGLHESGRVEITLLDDAPWKPGMAAANAPQFVCRRFSIRRGQG